MQKIAPTALIVCLCGSVRFKKEFLEAAQELELEGKIVVMPNVFSKADGIQLTQNQLNLLIRIHDQKLDMCDEVYVIDAPGKNGKPYIGNSTKNEINKAKQLGKPIRYISTKNRKLIGDSTQHEKIDENHEKPSTPLTQPSRAEIATKYCVDDLPGSLLSGSLLGKLLQQLEMDTPISEIVIEYLEKKNFIALCRYATNKSTFTEYQAEAELERTDRCSSTEAKAAKVEAERERKAEAIQKQLRKKREQAEARQRAYDNDPKNIAKAQQYELREKYDLSFFIEKPDFPKLMNILRQVDSGKRLSEKDVVWLSTEGHDYYTTELREGFHRNEAEFYAS